MYSFTKPSVLVPSLQGSYQLEREFAVRTMIPCDANCLFIRLIRLLAWISRRFGEENTQGNLINLRLTHQDLAELLGTTRVTVTRTLGQIEGQKLIQRLPLGRILLKEADVWYYQI